MAIIKPQRKTADQALEEVEEAIKRDEAGGGEKRGASVGRGYSPFTGTSPRRRSPSPPRRSRERSERRRERSRYAIWDFSSLTYISDHVLQSAVVVPAPGSVPATEIVSGPDPVTGNARSALGGRGLAIDAQSRATGPSHESGARDHATDAPGRATEAVRKRRSLREMRIATARTETARSVAEAAPERRRRTEGKRIRYLHALYELLTY